MYLKRFVIFLLTVTVIQNNYAQVSIRDSAISLNSLSFNYSFQIPAADMAVRFGNSSLLSVQIMHKTKKNIFADFSAGFFFGSMVNDSFILDNILTKERYLINNQGLLCPVSIEQRGFVINLGTGYLIPLKNPNPNSGILIGLGLNFLQHKIYFDYTYGPVYQIENEYRKGYDRLTNGFGLIQKIGYQRFGNSGLGNYHITFYAIEALTQSRRDFDFYLKRKDDLKRLDILFGFNVGFDIPIYRRIANEFYFN